MAKLDRKVLVIDVESTCWEPPSSQPKNEISEIIEIGIAVVDIDDLQIIKNESILVRPQKSKVSEFCTKLTTLTAAQVSKGIRLEEAAAKLLQEYDSDKRLFVSWGDYDRSMFMKNCKEYGCLYPFGARHLNLRNTFTLLHGLESEPALDMALEHIGMKLDGTHHRGIDDARNIAKVFIHTLKKFRE